MSEPVKDENEEDPIVMYLVVHEIGMSTGKLAAQIGHAVGAIYDKHSEMVAISNYTNLPYSGLQIWEDWKNKDFRKVTLTANDSKWNKLKSQLLDLHIDHSMIIDAGYTEIPRGSETVISIWPMRKSSRPPILRKLQAL